MYCFRNGKERQKIDRRNRRGGTPKELELEKKEKKRHVEDVGAIVRIIGFWAVLANGIHSDRNNRDAGR